MTAPDLRFTTTLADAVRLWWRNPGTFAAIAGLMAVPLGLLELLGHELQIAPNAWWVAGFAVAGLTVAAFAEALCAGLAEHALYHQRRGGHRMSLWRHARALPLLTLFTLALIVGLAVAVGVVLCLLPGLAVYAWLAVAAPVASFERVGPLAALRRGVALVRGRFWRVAALTSVTFVPALAADSVGSAVREWYHSVWLSVTAEAVCEAVVIGLTAAVVVVIYDALRTI